MQELTGELLPPVLSGVGEEDPQAKPGHRRSGGGAGRATAGDEDIDFVQINPPTACLIECNPPRRTFDMGES